MLCVHYSAIGTGPAATLVHLALYIHTYVILYDSYFGIV